MVQTHRLKTLDIYFDAVARGEKTFEVRRNDRAFQTGDLLVLLKIDRDGVPFPRAWTGKPQEEIRRKVTYLLQGGQFGIDPGYCVLGLGPVDTAP